MVRWLLVIVMLSSSISVYAKPNMNSYLDLDIKGQTEKIRVYQDHKSSKKWYVSPPQISLGSTDIESAEKSSIDNPGYSLDLMRYKGRKGSGDADKFWIKSVLHLEMNKGLGKPVFKQIRKAIKKEGYKVISLKPMPAVEMRYRVLMGDIDGSWNSGSDGKSRWTSKSIALALPDHMAQILWDSAEKQQQIMSIEVQTDISGVRQEQQNHNNEKKPKWNEVEITLSQTIPLQLNAEKFPDRFKRTDLDANIDFGYTGIDVFCFDFLEGNYPDLYAVLVDIKINSEDRDHIKQLRFDKSSDYRYRIDFGIAKELDKPYMVRLTYIDKYGKRKQEPWFKKHGELLLDVTRYK